MNEKWTHETPTEAGTYWLYGYISEFAQRNNQPEMTLVTVSMGRNALFFVADGQFLYRSSFYGRCLWTPATMPAKPERQLEGLLEESRFDAQ